MSASDFCDVCQCKVPGGARGRDVHNRGKAHCRKAGLRTEAVLLSTHRDRNGVSISSQETGLDFGVVEPGRVSRAFKSFVLKATTETADFMVLEPRWTSSSLSIRANTSCVTFLTCSSRLLTSCATPRSFSCGLEGDPHLRRGRDVRIIVRLHVTEIGTYRDTLEIRFSRVSNGQLFSVTRTVKAVVGDPADYTLLLPTAPYVPRRRSDRQEINDVDVVPGVPPPRLTAIAWRSGLKQHQIPESYRPTLYLQPKRSDTGEDIVPTEIRSLFPNTLSLSTHASRFCLLLWLEEVSMAYVVHFTHL